MRTGLGRLARALRRSIATPPSAPVAATPVPLGSVEAAGAEAGSSVIPAPGAWLANEEAEAFTPCAVDQRVKDSRPVDFDHLRGAHADAIRSAMGQISWYHRIELPHGIITPGGYRPDRCYETMGVGDHVRGKTVLDIGTMDGGFAFLCERDGAARVVGLDVDNVLEYDLGRGFSYVYYVRQYLEAKRQGPEAEWRFLNSKRLGFTFAKACLQSAVERVHGNVYDLSPERTGKFDVTLFLGLFYHLRSPLRAADAILSVTNERTFVASQVSLDERLGPNGCSFYEREYGGAQSNWFLPTPTCLMHMLLSVGYREVRFIAVEASEAMMEAVV